MKQIIALILFFISVSVSSQNYSFIFKGKQYEVDNRVVKQLKTEELNKLIQSNPERLMYLNHFAQHAYSIIDKLPEGKNVVLEELKLNPEFDGSFDIYASKIGLKEKNTYYSFGDKYVIVYSIHSFDKSYNYFLKTTNNK